MNRTNSWRALASWIWSVAALAAFAGSAPAQELAARPPADPPAASAPAAAPRAAPAAPHEAAPAPKPLPPRDERGRVIQPDDLTDLAFKSVAVEQVVAFIAELTGKVVVPQPDLLARKVTVINDQKIKRSRALDLVIFALQQNGIGIVETEEMVLMRDIAEIVRQDVPVLGPDTTLEGRTDFGSIVEKVFALQHCTAESLSTAITDAKTLPDYAKMIVDTESNQIAILGNVGLLQRIERLVESLDRPGAAALSTRTFHLRFADAEKIAANIRELFSRDDGRTGAQQQQQFPGFFRGPQQQDQGRRRAGGADQQQTAATSANLRVTANTQQNAVTVLAEKSVLDQIADAIENDWDLPLPDTAVVPRVYELKNSDPVKVRNLLESLFGRGSPGASTTGGGGAGGRGQQQQASSDTSQGVGRLAGQFSFEAIPESSRLVVVAKSPDNLAVIDEIIRNLDQPQTAGLPTIVELKHASAEELAEQLNALLAQEGTLAQIPRQETGLSEETSTVSPFASDQQQTGADNQNQQTTTANNISFWWQRARPPTDSAGASNLVSKVRIVPVWRQNALMIMSPPEYRQSLVDLVGNLDRPGRQVLLSVVIAEVSLDDATSLGLRWSSQPITPTNPDNAINLNSDFTGTKNDLIPSLFDTSVLNVTTDINVLLQALNQKTGVRILSEPRIYTSDNQEAEFFDGQDIPFVTDSQTTDTGGLVQSFDYRAVGLQLRVRPRITIKKDVDLRINLELANIQPNQTLFGAFIVDRRETTTHLIVKDGQTVVMSGILRREISEVKRKVPLLGDIPLIGYIFRSIEKSEINSELVAFITPVVVENTEAADSVYQFDRDRLDKLREQMDEKLPVPGTAPQPQFDTKRKAEPPAPSPPPANDVPPPPPTAPPVDGDHQR
jgi:general secretion pathway protein D